MERSSDWILALAGGLLLALMIDFNSLMAKHSTPVYASWVAHGIGTIASLIVIGLVAKLFKKNTSVTSNHSNNIPKWAYLGGIPGAFTVILAAVTVNSILGLAASLSLMLVGQVLFGIASDIFGFFGHPKRDLMVSDLFVALSVLMGSGILIYCRT
jgi:transporter family-2 protein